MAARWRSPAAAKTDDRVRNALAKWYEPSTLDLLENTPINCLLVTFSIGAPSEAEAVQRQMVKAYGQAARKRGIAVLGIVYPGGAASSIAAAAVEAQLDGLVLDGEFPADFVASLTRDYPGIVIPIAPDAASVRTSSAPLLAVQGVRPSARDLADMGIRAGASAEPWIDSNIWLVRSFRFGTEWRPIWVNQEPNPASEGDYVRCVADAAVAGGRWIVALDDDLRVSLFHRNADALGAWRRIGSLFEVRRGSRGMAPVRAVRQPGHRY